MDSLKEPRTSRWMLCPHWPKIIPIVATVLVVITQGLKLNSRPIYNDQTEHKTLTELRVLTLIDSDSIELRTASRLVFSESGRFATFWDLESKEQYVISTETGKVIANWRYFSGIRDSVSLKLKAKGVTKRIYLDQESVQVFEVSTVDDLDKNFQLQSDRFASCFEGDTNVVVLESVRISYEGEYQGKATTWRHPVAAVVKVRFDPFMSRLLGQSPGIREQAKLEYSVSVTPFEQYGSQYERVDSISGMDHIGFTRYWPTLVGRGSSLMVRNGKVHTSVRASKPI